MRKAIHVLLAVVIMAAAGCARPVVKYWEAIGGSRADATVKLAFYYNPTVERPEPNENQATSVASQKCQTWGYITAEAFGAALQQCTQWSQSLYGSPICYQMTVVKEYQCAGTSDGLLKMMQEGGIKLEK
ncbi:MAG: YecR-like lipofamily protein [Desulfovibrio sp.]|jgi:hypothetical protein|nr:YecR-like lipofamily protein [Desulfovibrio sp.]